jgi:hypothetical protein
VRDYRDFEDKLAARRARLAHAEGELVYGRFELLEIKSTCI